MKPISTGMKHDTDASFNSLLPDTDKERIVIVGGGLSGIALAQRLNKDRYDIVVLDRKPYTVYQPLTYKEHAESIFSGSFRLDYDKLFKQGKKIKFIQTDVSGFLQNEKILSTRSGKLSYSKLVIASGSTFNYIINDQKLPSYFCSGNGTRLDPARLLQYLVISLQTESRDFSLRSKYRNIVIVGGGRSGVELAAQLAEMKKRMRSGNSIADAQLSAIELHLTEPSGKLLSNMSRKSSEKARVYLENLNVRVWLNTDVVRHQQDKVVMDDHKTMDCHICLWTNKIEGQIINGIPRTSLTRDKRIKTDLCNKVIDTNDVYAIGYVASISDRDLIQSPPPSIQNSVLQSKQLAFNLNSDGKSEWKPLQKKNNTTILSVGWSRAVADVGGMHISGTLAKLIWYFIYTRVIPGALNKFLFLRTRMAMRFHYNATLRFLSNRPAIYKQLWLPLRILSFPITLLSALRKKA